MNRIMRSGRGRPVARDLELGRDFLLCYGACENCGWWAAMPEGAIWPKCPVCGEPAEKVMPIRPQSETGEVPLAFVGRFTTEEDAVRWLQGRREKAELRQSGGSVEADPLGADRQARQIPIEAP